ncbi:hypothetical protein C8F04DRAFT_1173152 [Mycena alexandri]|uniref:Uncharacterized protein n=1 Tax=Mycena alexandri TaxID=1745969 RepID=A0AAD6XIE5_9AGAR|nr:hypothetical protein C8F04DRAFT_1173152 [Mycena alexandri]
MSTAEHSPSPDTLTSNPAPDASGSPTRSWDTFAQAWGHALEESLVRPSARTSLAVDLIPEGPSRSWDDVSWQLGQADGEALLRASGDRSMGPGVPHDVLDDSIGSWNSRRAVRTIEIERDVATDAEADAIERRSQLLNNLFWEPLEMPAAFRESVQLQLARMEPRQKSRIQRTPLNRRKVHLFDEELADEGHACACRASPEPDSKLEGVSFGEEVV